MKTRNLAMIVISLSLVLILAGCTTGKTLTVTLPPVNFPGATITLPGGVTTVPAVTVTLPGTTKTIPATTVTVAPITTVQEADIQPAGLLLPSTPSDIVTHANITESLRGECLSCHDESGYYAYPTAPFWEGDTHSSIHYPLGYYVVAGSDQDHTGRGEGPSGTEECFTCHKVRNT